MSRFKEWDVVYDVEDDRLMIFLASVPDGNVVCEFSSGICNRCVTTSYSLVYIGRLWTKMELWQHQYKRKVAALRNEIKQREKGIDNLRRQIEVLKIVK